MMRVVVPLVPWPLRWLAVFVVAGFIFHTSIITVPPEVAAQTFTGGNDVFALLAELVGFAQDKWRHFVAYGAVGYTLAYATADWEFDRWHRALGVVAVAALYGAGIEVGQSFLPYRHFSYGDMLANALGALLVLPWYLSRPYVDLRTPEELLAMVRG